MADDPRVEQLLDEMIDSDADPEAVCGSDPELLPVVRNRWRQMRRLRADLNALFPRSDEWTPHDGESDSLPHIPGYEVEAVLGRGGMGVVFRARHLRLNRPVALKTVLDGGYAGPRERARFQREAEAVAALKHPNVVQVYDVGEVHGRPYLAMELIEGGSLAQKLGGTPQFAHLAAELVAKLADAMQVAHDAGIVHRDLKPANVLMADCTPKISDFGLARRLEGGSGLTQSGVPVGTPSYMSPEQARGQTNAVGPAADVYALGAILYECLTGRPPFRAATAAETIQQVISQEPVAPSRLNDKVSRDLDTICLKSLSKEPDRRYASAAALADDLRRVTEGRPIVARPVGWAERSWRWGRRNPTAAALLATALALVGLASGGGAWLVDQRARQDMGIRKDVGTLVAQAERLRKGLHFREARGLLERARQQLGPAGPPDLRRQVENGEDDLKLAERLDDVRIKAMTLAGGIDTRAANGSQYESAFADAGLGRNGDDIKAVAGRVRASSLSELLIAALDDWASISAERTRREWLLAVACEADGNPARNRLRRPELWTQQEIWKDPDQLEQVTQDLKAAEYSPRLAVALSRAADEFQVDAISLLTAAQARYPHDFWINLGLGESHYKADRWDEALAYYRAALAVRPDASGAYNNVGVALYSKGRRDLAIGYFEQALAIDSMSVPARSNLASALYQEGRPREAIDHFEQALRIDPKSAAAHYNFGTALLNDKAQVDKAIDHLQQAVSINPKFAWAHFNLGFALSAKKRLDEAIGHYEDALRINPAFAGAHGALGNLLAEKGRLDEAIGHFEQAVRIDPGSAGARNNLGTVLAKKGRLVEAISQFEQALRINPDFQAASNNLGRALYDAACAALETAAGQVPGRERLGEPERAEKRRQALAWLRANLELTTKLIKAGKLSAKSGATWQADPALASVRDSAALAQLPVAEREQWQRLWADVAELAAADPVEQGRAFAARRDWSQAADCYARVVKRGATDGGHFWFEYAALSLLSDDRSGYSQACAHLVERCGKPGGPRAYHVARACTLAPDTVAALPGRLAEKELQNNARQFWSLTEQGALAYRAGRYQEAVPLFEQSLKADHKPGRVVVNWLWLALANQRLGKHEEARRWLDTAHAWLDQCKNGMPARAEQEFGLDLHNWLEAHVLRREAEALIQQTGAREGY